MPQVDLCEASSVYTVSPCFYKRKTRNSRSDDMVSNCFPDPSDDTPTPRGSLRKVRTLGSEGEKLNFSYSILQNPFYDLRVFLVEITS